MGAHAPRKIVLTAYSEQERSRRVSDMVSKGYDLKEIGHFDTGSTTKYWAVLVR